LKTRKSFLATLQAKGYDGIVVSYKDVGGPTHVIVFSPDQVIPESAQLSLSEGTSYEHGQIYDTEGKPYEPVSGRDHAAVQGYPITRAEADQLAGKVSTFRFATKGPETTGYQGWFIDASAERDASTVVCLATRLHSLHCHPFPSASMGAEISSDREEGSLGLGGTLSDSALGIGLPVPLSVIK